MPRQLREQESARARCEGQERIPRALDGNRCVCDIVQLFGTKFRAGERLAHPSRERYGRSLQISARSRPDEAHTPCAALAA